MATPVKGGLRTAAQIAGDNKRRKAEGNDFPTQALSHSGKPKPPKGKPAGNPYGGTN